MAARDIEQLLQRAKGTFAKRDAFASIMRDTFRYAMPERDAFASYGYGQDRRVDVWDSTATVSTGRFGNRVQQSLVPAGQRWCGLALPPELADEEDAQPVQEDLQSLTDLVFRHIHQSNFDMVANEIMQELAAGTCALLIENGRTAQKRRRGPLLRFQAVPIASLGFDEGPFGLVEGIFYEQKLPARNVRRTYPDATTWPPEIIKAEKDNPESEIELLQATHYEPDEDHWCFEVILKEQKIRVLERYYRTNPWIIARWMKAPGEVHGRGPLTQALPDIRMLNYLMERSALAAGFATEGAWTVTDDGVTNPDTIRIAPGAMIPVRSNGNGPMGPSLKGLEMPGNWQLNQVIREELKTTVRQVMFDDPLPPEVQAGLTATEVIERVRRFQQDTGAFARLHAEIVVPIMGRVIDILEEAGLLADEKFRGIMDLVKEDAVRIEAKGPLAQAQDRADVQATVQTLQIFAQMGELGVQLIKRTVNVDKVGAFVASRMGMPQQLILSEKERTAQAQAEAEQQGNSEIMKSPVAAQVAGALAGGVAQHLGPKEQQG